VRPRTAALGAAERGLAPRRGRWRRSVRGRAGRGFACGRGRRAPGEPPDPAAGSSPCQVVYQVPLKEKHVLKRNVGQQLRIKIMYDRSVEE